MRLKINKACDLNSISVLPPPSRRPSGSGLGSDPSGSGMNHTSQPRSQSQQSFSQGVCISQLSQNSFEENPANDQRFGSQERDHSSKKFSSLVPITSTREESQMQLSRTSTNALRRWNSASIPDNRSVVNEEFEHRFQTVEGSLNRLGIILDSVQSDVMQANRAVKEVSLETEVIRQKISHVENSMQKMLRLEEDIKDVLEGRLKAITLQMDKESDNSKLNETLSSLSALPQRIQVNLVKLQHEICRVITKETEVIVSSMKSLNNNHPGAIQLIKNESYLATKQSQKCLTQRIDISPEVPRKNKRRISDLKIDVEYAKTLKPKLTNSKLSAKVKQEEIPNRPQVIVSSMKSLNNNHPGAIQLIKNESYLATKQSQKCLTQRIDISPEIPQKNKRGISDLKIDVEYAKTLRPKLTNSKLSAKVKQEEIPTIPQEHVFRINIDSDDESDGGASCLLLKKETGRESYLMDEAREETMRILRRARKRRRMKNSNVIVI